MKSKKIKVGFVQTKVTTNLDVNLEKTAMMIEHAAKKGAKIICLQELYKTPYFPQKEGVVVDEYVETIPGISTERFKRIAKKYACMIIVPLYEKTKNGELFNTAVVIDEHGEIQDSYRKLHIPEDPGFYEKEYFKEGNTGYKIFTYKNIKFAVLICFDQWFPEAARMARLSGAEMIFYPTAIANIIGYNAPEGDWHNAWETVMRGHAIANSVPVIAVNRVGKEDNSRFWGQSFVSDAFGKILKRAHATKEEVGVVELDLAMNEFISDGWGFLRNRRVDTYDKLTSSTLVDTTPGLKKVPHYKEMQNALKKK